MRKTIVIASAVIAMLIAVYTSINSLYTENNAEFIIVITIIMSIILGSSLVLPGIKLSRTMQVFLLIISVLFLLLSLFSILMGSYKIMTTGFPPPSEIYVTVMSFMFLAVIFIAALTYIIRILQPSGKTLLIILGILCALLTAAGIMYIHGNKPVKFQVLKQFRGDDSGVKEKEYILFLTQNEIKEFYTKKSLNNAIPIPGISRNEMCLLIFTGEGYSNWISEFIEEKK